MNALPVVAPHNDCWNRIGVRGDRTCPELTQVGHCHNCPVFAAAGRTFLNASSPAGYVDEWTERLAAPVEKAAADLQSVFTFRLAEEWLALPVGVLVEVTGMRPVHRIPFHAGILAGIVNVRGELNLCVHLSILLGLQPASFSAAAVDKGVAAGLAPAQTPTSPPTRLHPLGGEGSKVRVSTAHPDGAKLLVLRREHERWVCPVEEIGQVHRFPATELRAVPATVARAAVRLTRGVIDWEGRPVGVLDEKRLFAAMDAKLQ